MTVLTPRNTPVPVPGGGRSRSRAVKVSCWAGPSSHSSR